MRDLRPSFVVLLLVLSLTLIPLELGAQTTASLTGIVSSMGEPFAGARIVVRSPSLQGSRVTVTDRSGAYHLPGLAPGDYLIVVRAPGMREEQSRATLELSQTTRLDQQLVPVAGESMTVVSQIAPAVESKHVATTMPMEAIGQLPVQRNQLATAQFAPGVSSNTLSNGVLQISGGPGYDNLVIINGAVVNENTRGQMRPLYVEDAIAETTVLTGAISAEYGRFTGGVVNTITRSGTNLFDATLRDSLSNPRWTASSPANEAREDNLNHVWEGTLGGPVARDRIWFFTAGRWAKNDTARQTIAIPAVTGPVASPASPQLSYTESNDQKRYEAKITASLTQHHSLVAMYFGIATTTEKSRFANNIYDAASLTERADPESLIALRYQGVFGQRIVLEAQFSRRDMSLLSGALSGDLVAGTVVLDRANANARFNSPSRCGFCESEERDNDDVLLKASYYAQAAGSHALVVGIDRFTERHTLDDHQSGSDFSVFVTRVQWRDNVIYPVITPSNANGGGSFIRWTPVAIAAQENELRTDSLFVQDDWAFGERWNLSFGARYDRNRGVDSDGTLTADDSRLSPRVALQYDPLGNGRHRLGASYSEYASRVADAIASSNQIAGSAAAIDFAYRGPAINNSALTVPLDQALALLFAHFNQNQGGTANTTAQNLRANGTREIPGYKAYFDGSLATPHVREMTIGYGLQLGRDAFARADLVVRDWRDFYAVSVTRETRRSSTPLGIPVDLALVRNTDALERSYRGVHLQGRWSPWRFDSGVHYTWAKLRGNDDGETANGPVANTAPSLYYPELMNFESNNPVGYLRGDQRHRLRAWLGASFGRLNVSVLQTYDSGQAYSVSAPINLTRYDGAPANLGYNSVPNGRYFFTRRGELRADDVTSTNLALRYSVPFAGTELFAHTDLLNAFGEHAIADPQRLGTGVSTAANSSTLQPFNPFTMTPVEGVHYQYAANFGQPLNNLAYQSPRAYRVSLGLRF